MSEFALPPARRLYVHVPFCTRKCAYCAFASEPVAGLSAGGLEDRLDQYLGGLVAELTARRVQLASGPLDSVFFGGGTPSLLGPARVQRVLDLLGAWGLLEGGTEISLEANPESLGRAADWKLAGVRRLSLGIQSLDDQVLRWLGRPHDAAQAQRALQDAVATGLRVNGDLIIALPNLPRDVPAEVQTLAALGLGHIAVYVLGVEPGTPLAARLHGLPKREGPLDPDAEAQALVEARDALVAHGFQQYEVSNYARTPAQRCRHNLGYWHHEAYLGVGPAAHSFLQSPAGPVRSWNHAGFKPWLESLAPTGGGPTQGSELLTAEDLVLERLMLGLRCAEGLSLEALASQLGVVLPFADSAALRGLLDGGLLTLDGPRLRPTPAGMLQADGLAQTLSDLVVAGVPGLG